MIQLKDGEITGRIDGPMVSMKNSRRIVTLRNGRKLSIKSEKAMEFVRRFQGAYWAAVEEFAVDQSKTPITGRLEAEVTVHQEHKRRKDLDVELLYDCLQLVGLIEDDSQFDIKLAKRRFGKVAKVEFMVRRIAGQ